MTDIEVDSLRFTFPPAWNVSKYDEWAFYRNQFSKMWSAIKAVDLIAVNGQDIWLIEVKDYRRYPRTKSIDLADEIAQKLFCTLAAMLPAKVNASSLEEQQFAQCVMNRQRLRVVLHLEQPKQHSKLFPRAINPSNIQIQLRRIIKPIDPRPVVVESSQMQGLEWTVK